MAFPNQRLTNSEKIQKYGSIKNWAKAVHSSIDGLNRFNSNLSIDKDIQENYDLLEGRFEVDKFKDLIRRYGNAQYKMPTELEHYDIMTSKYELLRGEQSRRPFNWMAIQTNGEIVTKASQAANELHKRNFKAMLQNALAEEGLAEPSEEGVQDPSAINRYINYSWRDKGEIYAQQALNNLRHYLRLDFKFQQAWEHFLKSGSAIVAIDIVANEIQARIVDRRYCDFDIAHGETFVDKASWIREWRYITASDVYDEYYEHLTDEDVVKIEDMKGNVKYYHLDPRFHTLPYDEVDRGYGVSTFKTGADTMVKVCRLCWRALKKLVMVKYPDPLTEKMQTRYEGEGYIGVEGEEIKEVWVNEWWEATKIGEDIYVNCRPVPNQFANLDNVSKNNCPYVGIQVPYPIASKMKPYQVLYNVFMYHLKLDFATAIGRVGVFDIAQIPASEGFDIDKWLYYLKTFRIGFINSREEGSDGQRSAFNTWKDMDLSVASSIQHNIEMLEVIKKQLADLVGISPEREGSGTSQETLGGIERFVSQSNFITESSFYIFNEFKRNFLERLVNLSKVAYREGKKGSYTTDDGARVFFDIDPAKYDNAEIGIFISNSAQDNEALQTIKQLAQTAMQNQEIDLLDLAEIATDQNTTSIKNKLRDARARIQQMQERQAQQQQEQQLLAEQEVTKREMMIQDREDARAREKNETDIRRAEISALGFSKETDINNNLIPDVLEAEKIKQKEKEINKKLDLDKRKHQDEMELEREKMANEVKLQKQKLALEGAMKRMEMQQKIKQNEIEHKQKMAFDKQKATQDLQLSKQKTKAQIQLARSKPKPKKG